MFSIVCFLGWFNGVVLHISFITFRKELFIFNMFDFFIKLIMFCLPVVNLDPFAGSAVSYLDTFLTINIGIVIILGLF